MVLKSTFNSFVGEYAANMLLCSLALDVMTRMRTNMVACDNSTLIQRAVETIYSNLNFKTCCKQDGFMHSG